MSQFYFGTHRIQQGISDLLSVPITETWAAELTPHPATLWITAGGFSVGCFLAALVAGGSLRERKCYNFSHRAPQNECSFSNNQIHGENGTYSGAVVDFVPHSVADVLQLCLSDVVHRPHYMRDGLGAIERTATGLCRKKSQPVNYNAIVFSRDVMWIGVQTNRCNLLAHRIPQRSGFFGPGWTYPQVLPPLEWGWGVHPPMCGTVCEVETNGLGSSYKLWEFQWTYGGQAGTKRVEVLAINAGYWQNIL